MVLIVFVNFENFFLALRLSFIKNVHSRDNCSWQVTLEEELCPWGIKGVRYSDLSFFQCVKNSKNTGIKPIYFVFLLGMYFRYEFEDPYNAQERISA